MMCWGLIQIPAFQGLERCMVCGLRLAGSSDVELSILVAITKALWRQDAMARLCESGPRLLFAIYLDSQAPAIHS